ncbi:MAG: hypothetical protein ACLRI7_10240 [Ruthenibacterium lactatiformans]
MSCSVGKTVRGNDPEGYPFTGTIERLRSDAGALPDESWPPAPHRRSVGRCVLCGGRDGSCAFPHPVSVEHLTGR